MIPQDRYDAEMQFRRRLGRVALFAAVLVIIYLGIGLLLPDAILTRGVYADYGANRVIVVRAVYPAPFWLWPLARIDNPTYRFEYYRYGKGIWSCASCSLGSDTARSAQIKWDSAGIATVSLDHDPKYICRDGEWEKIK